MKFLVDKSIHSHIEKMLSNTSDDNCLVLAYGYFDSKSIPLKAVWSWLKGAKNRHLLLVIGIHGKPGFDSYLAASKGVVTVPMTVVDPDIQKNIIENLKVMFKECEWGYESLESPVDRQRSAKIHIVIAEHFHAKLAMTALVNERVNFYIGWPSTWTPTSAIFGSSNMTYAAQQYNLELDVMLERKDAALKEFGDASKQLLKSAITCATTDGSVSEEITGNVVDKIADFLAGVEYDFELEKKKNKAIDYDASRKEADADLD